jgi:hypothetical protein
VPTADAALVHLLFAASLRSDVIRGPMRGKEHCFVSAAEWLGTPPEPLDRTEALARLAHRYLGGHGPATDRDFARWAGITLNDARAGLAAWGDEIVVRPDGMRDLSARPAPAPLPAPRLLGPYDPLLCGWESRAFITGDHSGIVTSNGLFRPFALVDGRAVATWGLDRGRVTIRLLEPVKAKSLQALEADASDVLRYLSLRQADPVIVAP